MTSLRAVAVQLGGGEPDDVLPLRVDVVNAALRLCEAWETDDDLVIGKAEGELQFAVEKFKKAQRRRRRVT